MAMTNAQRQAAWRARRAAELDSLRKIAAKVEKQQLAKARAKARKPVTIIR